MYRLKPLISMLFSDTRLQLSPIEISRWISDRWTSLRHPYLCRAACFALQEITSLYVGDRCPDRYES